MKTTSTVRVPGPGAFGWPLPGSVEIVASSPNVPGSIGSASILRGSLPDFFRHDAPTNSIAFTLGGTSRIECNRGGRLSRFTAGPGGFSITPPGNGTAYRFERPLESLNLGIPPSLLRDIADREFRPYSGSVELVAVHQSTMPEIVWLGQSFAQLIRSPRRGSRLYAESLWNQIAIQLLWNFSSLPREGQREVEPLSRSCIPRVIDYIESTLHADIGLSDLAEVAGLTPNHFVVAFKKATGMTPHRYRTERRVARACELLRNPAIPIVSVSLAVGFSSQSHFTTVFGRLKKITPALYRAQVLAL